MTGDVARDPAGPVLLFGARGWIGAMLQRIFEVDLNVPCIAARSRAENAADVFSEMTRLRPRLVFAALGRTHGVHEGRAFTTIDYLEQPGRLSENLRDNLVAPVVLASTCQRLGVPCAQIATGCIFERTGAHEEAPRAGDEHGFSESDDPNFTGSSYSTVKGHTDLLLSQLFSETTLFFRIRMPLSHDLHPRSFLTKILRYDKVCSIPNSMSVLDGPRGLLSLFARMALAGMVGCYNGTNPGVMAHNDILRRYQQVVDADFEWKNFSEEEQAHVLAARRSNNQLDSRKLQAAADALDFPLPTLPDAVEGILQELATSARRAL